MQDLTRRHKLIGIAALAVLSWMLRDEGLVPTWPSGFGTPGVRLVAEPPVRQDGLQRSATPMRVARWSRDERAQAAGAEPALR